MAKTEQKMDISIAPLAGGMRSRSAILVPKYSLYGEASPHGGWFVNVEPLEARAGAENWKIEPHTHPKFTQVIFVSKGEGVITMDGDVLSFGSSSVLVVPPFHIHSIYYESPARGWVVTIENGYLAELVARAPELRSVLGAGDVAKISHEASVKVASSVKRLKGELEGTRCGRLIGAEVELLQILLTLLRETSDQKTVEPLERNDLVDRYLNAVETRYRDQPDVAEFATDLGVTIPQLRLACKARTGSSPLAILHDRILAEAKRCLTYSTLSVAETGYRLGFTDAAYFSRFFTGKIGLPPSQFRRARAR